MTTNQRTKELYEKEGYHVAVAERYISHAGWRPAEGEKAKMAGHTVDLFGLADLIAYDRKQVVLIQCTTASNASSHKSKIENNEELLERLIDWVYGPSRQFHLVVWYRPRKFKIFVAQFYMVPIETKEGIQALSWIELT